MRIEETPTQTIAAIESFLVIAERVLAIARNVKLLRPKAPRYSYENTLLSLVLDLRDSRGRKSVITRKQSVRFHTREAGVLTSPGWGEGQQMRNFEAEGAEWLGTRSDGPRKVALLALSRPSSKDARFTVTTRESAVDAFLTGHEYFEARIERPTKRLSLKVFFPKGHAPKEAHLTAPGTDGPQKLTPRLGSDGRAIISWSGTELEPDTTYSVRWSW